jgi:hypothetical protein
LVWDTLRNLLPTSAKTGQELKSTGAHTNKSTRLNFQRFEVGAKILDNQTPKETLRYISLEEGDNDDANAEPNLRNHVRSMALSTVIHAVMGVLMPCGTFHQWGWVMGGLAWLIMYCQANPTPPTFEKP